MPCRAAVVALAFALVCPSGARAARPLLDQHQWDSSFAILAQDTSVPWKATTVRLDTYSGAPVDFAAYAVDPAEVIVAGANRPARAIDTSRLQPAARWRFSPPPGYRFETSNVQVPLGSSEGFYVIEARRGDAMQQVWVNRSHIALLTKESPEGLVLWLVDLRSGLAARDVKVEFLVGGSLVSRNTDRNGLIVWRDATRPTFALAQSGASRAFVSLLPQAPLPSAIVGVRVESAVVRAGQVVRAFGFARRRSGGTLRRVAGDVKVTLAGQRTTLAAENVHLDAAGAFVADLSVPAAAGAGDYAVLASAGGTVGGTSIHVDAAGDVALAVAGACPCDGASAVPIVVSATRDGAPAPGVRVRVQIVRTPHVVPPGERDDAPRWGTTLVLDSTLTTGADGHAQVAIPPPTDGLASTYGVRAATDGNAATATAQLALPTAPIALAVEPDAAAVALGQPIGLELRGFTVADGAPASGVRVTVRLAHGVTSAAQPVTLDDAGHAHVVFHDASLGSNLLIADAAGADGRHALDAASVDVSPVGAIAKAGASDSVVSVALDRTRYRPGERIGVSVAANGAAGDALVTLEGARTYQERLVPLSGGHAAATIDLADVQGDTRIDVSVVRDGSVVLGSAPLQIDAPGHVRALSLSLDRAAYAAGDLAHVALHGGDGPCTVVMRVTDSRPTGGAEFDDIAAVLAAGGTTSQNPFSENPAWHVWVQPAKSRAVDVFGADRPRDTKVDVPAIGAAAPRTVSWRVDRVANGQLDLPVPALAGTYLVSVVQIFDDGDVGAASSGVVVR